jgi:hypothetical protein
VPLTTLSSGHGHRQGQRGVRDGRGARRPPGRRDESPATFIALDFEQNVRAARPGKRVGGLRLGALAPADFFPRYLVHTKGPAAGQPFKLEPWQRRFVEKFSRVNGDGERIYKRGMLGVARGNGKTPLAAGLALRELLGASDEPDVILAAAARDQAPVCFEYARGFVESGFLADVLQVGRHEIRNRLNGGVLRTVSADGFVAHGLNPSACVIDELYAWSSGKQVELFDALDTAIHKGPGAFWLVITTASHDKTSLLGRLYGSMLEALELRTRPVSSSAATSGTECSCIGTGPPRTPMSTTASSGGP